MKISNALHFNSESELEGQSGWLSIYVDPQTNDLRENTEIWIGGAKRFETNSLACKGGEPEGALPLICVIGDSPMFGDITSLDSPVARLVASGFQFLNGCVPVGSASIYVKKIEAIRSAAPCAALVAAWTPASIASGAGAEIQWRQTLERIQGDEPLFVSAYAPNSDTEERYLSFLKGYCAERGATLIDLTSLKTPREPGNLEGREQLYKQIGEGISRCLTEALAGKRSERGSSSIIGKLFKPKEPKKSPDEEVFSIYPMW